MEDLKTQISDFMQSCEEIKNCKFIMAPTKIKACLKCIVNCPDLYRLFEAVTKDFDYPAVRQKCLVTLHDGVFKRSYIVLPQTVGQRLAFIFCLFVEFDRDTLNFNEFLRRYFPEDGSYYASYQAFCNMIVKGLQDAVTQVFRNKLEEIDRIRQTEEESHVNSARAEFASVLALSIAEEQDFIAKSEIPEEDKEGGVRILTQLIAAVRAGDEQMMDALICGYNYFVLYHRCVSEGVAPLIQAIAEYEKLL